MKCWSKGLKTDSILMRFKLGRKNTGDKKFATFWRSLMYFIICEHKCKILKTHFWWFSVADNKFNYVHNDRRPVASWQVGQEAIHRPKFWLLVNSRKSLSLSLSLSLETFHPKMENLGWKTPDGGNLGAKLKFYAHIISCQKLAAVCWKITTYCPVRGPDYFL